MPPRRQLSAKELARRRGNNGYWLDHAEIKEEDFAWLEAVERLYLWNVCIPQGFLSRLKKLWWLTIRGGSAQDLSVASGATRLKYLEINQIRGVQDLSVIREMLALRYLNLYGLAKVRVLPSFRKHKCLEHASLGQMTALQSLQALLDAPALRELQLIRKINVLPEDIARILIHPSLREFNWFAEDVPDYKWKPVIDAIGLPALRCIHPEEWFGLIKPW